MSETTTQPTQPQGPRMITNVRELIQDVGRWADRQPWATRDPQNPKHAPDYGLVEELGELCHGVLKNIQGIKGMDNIDKFRDHMLDALGDIMVFLSHWCHINNCYFTPLPVEQVKVPQHMEMRDCVAQILVDLSRIFTLGVSNRGNPSMLSAMATGLCHTLQFVARMFGWDLIEDCLFPTWHHVRLRDWSKNAEDGGRAEALEEAGGTPDSSARELPEAPIAPEQIEGEKPIGDRVA